MATKIKRYGRDWDASAHTDLSIELWMIAKGQLSNDQMFEHMMRARKLAWPQRYRHRWTDLIYRNVIENVVTVLMGCGSAQKTSHASEIALLRYWARPNDSLCLVSTTTVDKLEMAVFGELKMLHRDAQTIHPWLAGNVIDSKKMITTDLIEEDESRDCRRGIVGRACYVGQRYVGLGVFSGVKQNQITFLADECFPNGTMVDTPLGPKPIETIGVGDVVGGAIGTCVVEAVSSRVSDSLVRVLFADGRSLDCTPNHPILTQMGWINAIDLDTHHYVLSPHESMQIMREGNEELPSESKILQRALQACELQQGLQVVQDSIYPIGYQKRMLFKTLHDEIKDVGPSVCEEGAFQHRPGGKGKGNKPRYSFKSEREKDSQQPDEENVSKAYYNSKAERGRSFSREPWCDSGRVSGEGVISYSDRKPQGSHRGKLEIRECPPLQTRSCVAENNAWGGNRWQLPQQGFSKAKGQTERRVSFGSWVDRVEVLEPSGDKRSNRNEGGYRVYNLQVTNHPSYSVNGFLVHNCQFMASTFFDCLPNMFQSAGLDHNNEPDVKVIPCGNPRHDPFDQLSIAAEPVAGWDSVKDVEKTSVWKTKFHRGACVNLIGTDSPNFDVPDGVKPPYPRLVNRQTCKMIEARWKPGTLQHNSQVVGKMIMGMLGNRVLTKQICEEHHAFDKAVWRDTEITKLWFLDPAWGGHNADRCVWGWLEFGTEITGRQIMRMGEFLIVPIFGEGGSPDDQIALFCKQQARARDIPLGRGFYDSTGRGTVGAAFARIFAGEVPTPVAFGDRPSKRPVRHDLFVTDEVTHVRRHKRCDEEYGKYVTELWFAVRNVVECDQMRELPEDVMQEGCMREYAELPGGKIDVETKDEMRERIGYSPDLFDALVVGVEGARQLGFRIDRLGYDILEDAGDDDFFETEAKMYQEAIQSQLLQH